jgi:hypothetical protein
MQTCHRKAIIRPAETAQMLKPNKIELVMELTTLVSTIPGDTQTMLMPASAGILL